MGKHAGHASKQTTGYHRAVANRQRRKVAAWPLACLTVLTLVALSGVGWNWLQSSLDSQAEAQTSACEEGTATLTVLTTPAVERPVAVAADRWNQSGKVVRAHCIQVAITSIPTDQVLQALPSGAQPGPVQQQAAGWITEAIQPVHDFAVAKPELISSPAEQVAQNVNANYLYVGLSGDKLDNVHKHATQVFRDFLKQPAQQILITSVA